MKQPLSIGEISKLLKVPKSTLRYWESEGLFDLPRNGSNNYREYSYNTLVSISDLVYYRSLNMPLKEMKRLKELTPLQLKESLKMLDKNLDEEINRLLKSKGELKNRMENMNCYMKLVQSPYQQEKIDFSMLYFFDYNSSESWAECINNQYENIIYFEKDSKSPMICITKAYTEESSLLWEAKDVNRSYITFPLEFEYGNPSAKDFIPHFEKIQRLGYETNKIFGRYLFSAFEGRHCDFYKGYAELLN